VLYLEHFGLEEPPFRLTPHTDFFFEGADRGATLDALLYAILHDEGIVKVSGEVGSGKTMLCRVLMERLPQHVEIVYLANPSLARDEILHAVADDLGVAFSQNRATVALRELEEYLIDLYSAGRRVVLLIDEAHAMPEDTLEQVRLFSNLESSRQKLLQIVLFGQPELDTVLSKSSMRQLKDRITHSFRMRPLTAGEISKYLAFRMRAAGYRGPDTFSPAAVKMIANAASGLTRRVNILADKSLLAAFTENRHAVTKREARIAINDSDFGRLLNEKRRTPLEFVLVALVTGLLIGAGLHWAVRSDGGTQNVRLEVSTQPQRPANSLPAHPNSETSLPLPTKSPSTEPKSGDSANISSTADNTRLGEDAAKRIAEYETGPNRLLRARIEATRNHVGREPDGSYSIELFSTDNSDPGRLERFLTRAKQLVDLEEILVLPQGNQGRYRIRVTFGRYPDRTTAERAAEDLPAKYKQAFRSELRTFAELRSSL
jgi:MSHA biogenesis protein MshM